MLCGGGGAWSEAPPEAAGAPWIGAEPGWDGVCSAPEDCLPRLGAGLLGAGVALAQHLDIQGMEQNFKGHRKVTSSWAAAAGQPLGARGGSVSHACVSSMCLMSVHMSASVCGPVPCRYPQYRSTHVVPLDLSLWSGKRSLLGNRGPSGLPGGALGPGLPSRLPTFAPTPTPGLPCDMQTHLSSGLPAV